jgi:hypothetical protein
MNSGLFTASLDTTMHITSRCNKFGCHDLDRQCTCYNYNLAKCGDGLNTFEAFTRQYPYGQMSPVRIHGRLHVYCTKDSTVV